MKKKLINCFCWPIIVIFFSTGFFTWYYRQEIFTVFDGNAIGQAYSQSQYVLGDQALQKIGDGSLYQYAAQAYFRGEDPTTINFEHPPLGKYVFGLSLWIFNRPLVVNIFLYAGCLTLFTFLLKRLKFSTNFILLTIIFIALGSGLAGHLRTALFDLQILFWSLSFFIALFIPQENWQKYGLIGLILGMLMATKYFFPIIFLFLGLLSIWAWWQHSWLKIIFSMGIAGLIYLLSYTSFFLHQHSLIDFAKFEWFRFRWWTGNRTIPRFIILQTLFLGKYQAWWESNRSFLPSGDWNFSWPIIFVGYLTALFSFIRQQLTKEKIIIILYTVGLLSIYLFGSAVYGRYLLQLIPFWLIIIGWGWQNVKKNQS